MATSNLNASGLQFVSVQDLTVDPKGPASIPVLLDWSQASQYNLDLSHFIQQQKVSLIQAVYIENGSGTQPLQIQIPGTRQTLQIPAGSEAYLMLIAANPLTMSFLSTDGANKSTIHLLNYPVTNAVWKVS